MSDRDDTPPEPRPPFRPLPPAGTLLGAGDDDDDDDGDPYDLPFPEPDDDEPEPVDELARRRTTFAAWSHHNVNAHGVHNTSPVSADADHAVQFPTCTWRPR